MEPRLPALGVWNLSHQTTREVPKTRFIYIFFFSFFEEEVHDGKSA